MTREDLENFMLSYNFDLWAILPNNTYQFLSRDPELQRVVNCIVNLTNNTFEFKFLVPYTTFTLNSGKFSPITNEAHFSKNKRRFMKQVDILLEGNNI